MFRLGRSLKNLVKPLTACSRGFQVAVVGASRPLGQSISLLLKQHPLIHRLTMYDNPESTFGIAMDVSHIPREPLVEGWTGRMEFALRSADVAVIAVGEPKKKGQTDTDLFKENADALIATMQEVVAYCPTAFTVVATEPLNFTVPLAAKVLESGDAFNKNKVFGVSGIDTMRAQTWCGGMYQVQPHVIRIPVICGHSSETTIPLFSHILPRFDIDNHSAVALTEYIRNTDESLTHLKNGPGEPTLSMAYATYCTTSAILNAMNGYAIEHVAFIANNDYGTKFFSTPIIITAQGVSAIMRFKVITALEADYVERSTEQLSNDVFNAEGYFNFPKDYPRYAKANVNIKIY